MEISMNKKDRIALVISALFFLFPLFFLLIGEIGLMIFWVAPLILYWGYRFIKDDISFLDKGKKEED